MPKQVSYNRQETSKQETWQETWWSRQWWQNQKMRRRTLASMLLVGLSFWLMAMRLPTEQASLRYSSLPDASRWQPQTQSARHPWSGWALIRLPRMRSVPLQPPKVALQIGHEGVVNHPPELRGLRWNTGGYADGVHEVDVNRRVVEQLERRLLALGVDVDILPATPPIGYQADLFISVHADSVRNPNRRGYKSAHFEPPRNALEPRLRAHLDEAYLQASRLADDSINVSPAMREFYAFNHRKYRHSVHPDTPAVIVEMGYISNPNDRAYLSKASEPADALFQGIVNYLREQGRLPEVPARTTIELPELRAEVMRLK
jgi:N-acetylmuramoyl-L-alanine amidase